MRLTSKISLILVVMVLVTGCLIGVLCIENINDALDEYLYETHEVMLNDWAHTFVAYYTYNGNNWDGVENLGHVAELKQSGVVLSNLNGRVLYHYDDAYIGRQVPQEIYSRGYILRVDNQVIGILYPAALFSDTFMQLEQNFVKSTMVAVVKGAFFTSLFAIIIGMALSIHIVHPVRELTRAAKRMAKGNFEEPLPIYSTDEIGDLSRSFNTMAQEIEHGIEMREQMMADTSHELRTPLTVLASKLEFSLEQNKPLETEEIVVLYDEVIRLKGLVNELQDLSKLEAGHAVLDKTLIKFADYFEDFAVLLDAEAESRNMTLEVNLKEAPEYCYADPKRLKQIVLNLVNNAFRYTPEGGTVTIIAKEQDGDFLFSVQDTGMGIAPEDVNKIFDRFYRTDRSRDRESGGSGLGLAITKALVDAHGGWIKVDSQLNAGTTFTVMLPGWKDIVE
ncbi:MAG: HAMP domain-containing protein [Peptococcaceae bacterium]|nr:HAMP domain-containing protein [Peptococcaceae bacterium]